jgi:hypothetical protein
MFREINISKQTSGGPKRRWYQSEYFDLFIWYIKHDDKRDASANREFVGAQLCYDIRRNQRALTWKKETGFVHTRVSGSGDTMSDRGASASLLMDGGEFDHAAVLDRFMADAPALPSQVRRFVMGKLTEYATATLERPSHNPTTFGAVTDIPAKGLTASGPSMVRDMVDAFSEDMSGKPPPPAAPVPAPIPASTAPAVANVVISESSPPMPKRDPLALTGKFATIKEDIRTFGKP